MKLFISYQQIISLLVANPDNPPFLTLMNEAFYKGRYEAKQVYFNPNNKELLNNCKKEIMTILLREAGYNAQLIMELEDKFQTDRKQYDDWLKEQIAINGPL